LIKFSCPNEKKVHVEFKAALTGERFIDNVKYIHDEIKKVKMKNAELEKSKTTLKRIISNT